jgi:hypothetical protein
MSNATLLDPARVALVLVSLVLMVAGGCTTRALVDPPPVAAAATPVQTRAAILRALIESGYSIVSEQPGEIVARYSRSDWTMVVAIDYSDRVSVRYVSSENLDYRTSDGAPVIHRGYNHRVKRLSNVIGTEIAIARATDDLPAVAAPPADEIGTH